MNVHLQAPAVPDTSYQPDDRLSAILVAAKNAFAEKGFDGASMQDLARAAQMSAGNFYRYFASKNALIEALIAHDLAEIRTDFGRVQGAEDPMMTFETIFSEHFDRHDCTDAALWAEIDAMAGRRPEVRQIVLRMEAEIEGYLNAVFGMLSGLTPQAVVQRFPAHATFLIVLFKASMQRLNGPIGQTISDETRAHLRDLVLKNIHQTLEEVAAVGRGLDS